MMRSLSPVLTFLLCTSLLSAQPPKKKEADPAEIQKIFAAVEKAGKPGAEHKKLDAMIGNWTYRAEFWMTPGTEAMVMEGTSSYKWLFGGRFVQQDVDSKAPMPFQGFGLVGYDNLRKKYTAMWTDSMSTSIYISKGTVDKSGKVFTFLGREKDPVSGAIVQTRDVIRLVSKDVHVMEAYRKKDGKEAKVMKITYNRKK